MGRSRWRVANLLVPVSQVSWEGEAEGGVGNMCAAIPEKKKKTTSACFDTLPTAYTEGELSGGSTNLLKQALFIARRRHGQQGKITWENTPALPSLLRRFHTLQPRAVSDE